MGEREGGGVGERGVCEWDRGRGVGEREGGGVGERGVCEWDRGRGVGERGVQVG